MYCVDIEAKEKGRTSTNTDVRSQVGGQDIIIYSGREKFKRYFSRLFLLFFLPFFVFSVNLRFLIHEDSQSGGWSQGEPKINGL